MKRGAHFIEKFVCPITRQPINEVGITSDGFFYEKFAIDKWLSKNTTSPQTGLPINRVAYPCNSLQKQLDKFYIINPSMRKKRFQRSMAHDDNLSEINNILDKYEYNKLLNYNKFNWGLFNRRIIKKLMKAANDTIIEHLINNTITLEYEDRKKRRPIHHVCQYRSAEIIKLLVDKGVNLECENIYKSRPIHIACGHGSFEAVKILVDNRVNLECENVQKLRPIHFACASQTRLEIAKLLIDKGVDLDCDTVDNSRPIHLACQPQSLDIVRLLIDNRVNLECQTNKKARPIHMACANQSFEIIKLLIDSGIDLKH